MDMHDLTRQLHVKNDSKIVMLSPTAWAACRSSRAALTELETAKHPQPRRPRQARRPGRQHPRAPRHHPRQRPGPPGPVRLRSAQVPHRPRRARSHRHRLRARGRRRRHPRQLLHARRRRATSPTAAPAASPPKRAHRWPIKLREVKIPGVEVFVEPVKEHRFVVVLPRRRASAATWTTPTRRPPACRRSTAVPRTPTAQKTAEVANEFVAPGRASCSPDEPKANGLTLRGFSGKPQSAELRRSLRPEGRGDRRLSDVQGPRPAGRHGHRRQRPDARRADGPCSKRTGTKYDFFFIHFKYTDSTRRGRQLRRQGEADRRTRRRRPADHGPEARRAHRHRRPQHAEHARQPQLAPGADAARGRRTAAPTAAKRSAKANASAAASASSKPSTSCRWPWPTPAGWASTAPSPPY